MTKSSRQRLLTNFFGERGVNFLVKIKRKFSAVIEFYCEVLKSKINTGASLRLVFFPFNGGMFGSSRVPYPAEFWESYIWIDKICKYGASVSWNENIVTLDYMDTKISANALDSSIETVFFEMFRDDEYKFHDMDFKGMSVLDIGGNIGDTAVKFCLLGASRVVVFEPLPSLFPLLEKNILDNSIQDRVTIYNVGLADTNYGMTLLVRPNATAGTSTHLHSVDAMRRRYDHDVEKVQIKDFRPFFEEEKLGFFDVVKLDCEHCEYALFKDDTFLQMTRPKYIFLEYHSGYSSIYELLAMNGYSVDVFEKNDRVGVLKAVHSRQVGKGDK